ncbi:hypothetical protein TEHN7126_2382 [Tetragenococcus halophilus subsp. halophilus]|uniref:Panacea domain-containing protein n=2 Tax=Tetragenococcus halophilus TaxID=51669 RepID=UPI000CC2D890|nr:hypothetical protein TEHN7126_2382 [Tetragenococcus halophilus subsp. halophilus]
MMEKNVVFSDINVLAKYVIDTSDREMTPLRLQKTLYFLFAFYGATYGQLASQNEEDMVFEGSGSYPKYLFDEDIEAWNYGPVIRDIYKTYKYESDKINNAETWKPESDRDLNISDVIDQVIKQTDEMGDFSLVDRTHEDEEWKRAFDNDQDYMDKDAIIEEYKIDAI